MNCFKLASRSITVEDLLQFKPYSYQFFYDSAYHQTKGWLKEQEYTETEIEVGFFTKKAYCYIMRK
jgi:hypothetical protein